MFIFALEIWLQRHTMKSLLFTAILSLRKRSEQLLIKFAILLQVRLTHAQTFFRGVAFTRVFSFFTRHVRRRPWGRGWKFMSLKVVNTESSGAWDKAVLPFSRKFPFLRKRKNLRKSKDFSRTT